MAFHLGSLGFLTPFKFEDFETQVKEELENINQAVRIYVLFMKATRA